MECAGEESQRKKKTKKSIYTKIYILQFYSTDAGGVVLQQRWCVSPKHHGITSQMTVTVSNRLQAWKGPEGSWRLRLPDFKTIGT